MGSYNDGYSLMAYPPQGGNMNNGTLTVNGQIIGVPMSGQFFPSMASAPFYKGSGQPPPTVPLNYLQNPVQMNAAGADAAAGDPWNPTVSPLVWSIGAVVVGILWLRFIHWRH